MPVFFMVLFFAPQHFRCSEIPAECGLLWLIQAVQPIKIISAGWLKTCSFNTWFSSPWLNNMTFFISNIFLSSRCTWPWCFGPKGPVWPSPPCAWCCCLWPCWWGWWGWLSTETTGTMSWPGLWPEGPSLPSWWEGEEGGSVHYLQSIFHRD